MNKSLLMGIFALVTIPSFAQETPIQEDEKFPLGKYTELTDNEPRDDAATWNAAGIGLTWVSSNQRYPKHDTPKEKISKSWSGKAWKGERVNAQALLWSNVNLKDVSIEVSDLVSGKNTIPSSAITTNFIGYVMTDEYSNAEGDCGCNDRADKSKFRAALSADPLDCMPTRDVMEQSVQPIWMSIYVPQDANAGTYKGTLKVKSNSSDLLSGSEFEIKIALSVSKRALPKPEDWKFHLDLGQNPYTVARYYQVPLWSKEHFDALRPIMQKLQSAGQKVVTATLSHMPWSGQTEDPQMGMIFRKKKIDGTWEYDYTVFDKWVSFMVDEIGITEQINCYSMVPWSMTFDYFDEASNQVKFFKAAASDQEYYDYWHTFAIDFARHLKEKGWFERTTIAMDERPLDVTEEVIRIIRDADPGYRFALSGHNTGEVLNDLYDFSIAFNRPMPEGMLKDRTEKGMVTTIYTCCTEEYPNMFTCSPVAETPWTMWHALAAGYSGYLRWAYNSWTIDPLRDSRFRTWTAGDTYLVYPGFRSSIRMEKIVEGVQDAEKIRILREEFEKSGDTKKLKKLNDYVATFVLGDPILPQTDMTKMVEDGQALLNSL